MNSSVRTQLERVTDFCRESEANCEVTLLSDPSSEFLKFIVRYGSTTLYESHDFRASDLAAMSDDALWNHLEQLSNRRIRRPAA
jgi:hypothetical protein